MVELLHRLQQSSLSGWRGPSLPGSADGQRPDFYRARENASRVCQFIFAVFRAARTAVSGDPVSVFFVDIQMAALWAYDTDQVFQFFVASFAETVISPSAAFSRNCFGITICSISPGAMCSRLKWKACIRRWKLQ